MLTEIEEIQKALKLEQTNDITYVMSLVIHKNSFYNELTRLSCRRYMPFSGYPTSSKPITRPLNGGYVYDFDHDSYIINCIDHFALGAVPVSYRMKMDEAGIWSCLVPLPESVILKHLSSDQLYDLQKFRASYLGGEFTHQFIQFSET